ncbi:MAG: ACT domain-containing protein [Candidatus Melainabacteria bacterium]|nr:ACT domain-containing protein [Candidatus Melainabacteria bacterium]
MNSQKNYFAIFVLGTDGTGIVADISKALFELGANINDSSHTIIGNQFAMLLLISTGPGYTLEKIQNVFQDICKKRNLTIHVHELKDEDIYRKSHEMGQLCVIHLYGADKPGIVYQVTNLLAKNNVNITDLSTRRFGNETNPIYIMYLEAEVPTAVDTRKLGSDLNKIAADLNVEIKYELEEVASL